MNTPSISNGRLRHWMLQVLLASVIGAGLYFFFVIRVVTCRVDDQECTDQTQQALHSNLVGKSLFFTDIQQAVRAEDAEKSLTLVEVSKSLPHTVMLRFTSEQALYELQIVDAQSRVIGDQGTVKSELHSGTQKGSLAQVRVASPDSELLSQLSQASRIPAQLHEPIRTILLTLQEERVEFSQITWVSSDEIWVDVGSVRAIMDAQHPAGNVQALAQILESVRSSPPPQPLREIDLRFTLPVLRTVQ